MANLTEEDRIKAIPGKAMMGAITAMNTYLAEKDQTLVVFDKLPKAEALANLLVPIVAAIEAGEAENLPEDVIAFYNDHLVVEDAVEEKPAKAGKADKPKKEKKEHKPKVPKAPSNEQNAYDMVKAGKTPAEILEHFKGVYAGKGKDDAFIAKRSGIYENIGKRKLASEDPKFAATWAAEKEAAKPKKEPKVKKEKVAKDVAPDAGAQEATGDASAPAEKPAAKKAVTKKKTVAAKK